MKIILMSICSLDIEQYVEFEMSGLMSPLKSLSSLHWITHGYFNSVTNCVDFAHWESADVN